MNPEFAWADRWRAECERAMFYAGELLHLAGRRVLVTVCVEVIRTAPREAVDPNQLLDDSTFWLRILREAGERSGSDPELRIGSVRS
jgi:hypothetical protein